MCYGRELSCHQHLVLQSLFVLLSYVLYVIFLRAERSLALLVIMHTMHVPNVLKHFPLKSLVKRQISLVLIALCGHLVILRPTANNYALEYKSAHTKEEQKEIECNYGCRYFILQELLYYDIIRFCH